MSKLDRRSFLKAVGIGAGAAMGTRLAGPGLFGEAHAQAAEKPALFIIYLSGGYNSLFPSAKSYLNSKFGVVSGNVMQIPGGGPLVDNSFAVLPKVVTDTMVSAGLNHRQSAHQAGQMGGMTEGAGPSFAVQLASAMGGDGSLKCVTVGGNGIGGLTGTSGGVSIQNIADVRPTIDALKGNDTLPDRGISGKALTQSQVMSAGRLAQSPKALDHMKDGYDTVTAALGKAAAPFDFASVFPAYGINNSTSVQGWNAKVAAAELMIRAGSNVVVASDGGWDSHGDTQGTNVRNMMQNRILPPLVTFMRRFFVNNPEAGVPRNVVVAIMGDFARSLPGSDHATGVSVSIMGKYTKPGTTGELTANVGFNPNQPSGRGIFQLYSALLKVPGGGPFGANTAHASLVK